MYLWTGGFYKTAYSPTVPCHAQGNLGGFIPQTYEIHVALQDTYFKVKQMAVGSPPRPPPPSPFFSLIENYIISNWKLKVSKRTVKICPTSSAFQMHYCNWYLFLVIGNYKSRNYNSGIPWRQRESSGTSIFLRLTWLFAGKYALIRVMGPCSHRYLMFV